MRNAYLAALTLLVHSTASAEIEFTYDLQILADQVTQNVIAQMDFNQNGKIDAGDEAHAVVRYVNHLIFRTYDADHNGQLTGYEAERYVAEKVQPGLDSIDEYYTLSAYKTADKRFANGVDLSQPDNVIDIAPLAPLYSKFALSFGYGNKSESGKDVESFTTGLEFKWGSFALGKTPIVAGSKLSFSNEETFLPTARNEVSRWTIEPLRLTLGADKWRLQPTIGLGYGESDTVSIADGALPATTDDNEFVWDVGFAIPLAVEWAKLTITKTIRLENISSDKKSDDVKAGIDIDIQKLLGLPK